MRENLMGAYWRELVVVVARCRSLTNFIPKDRRSFRHGAMPVQRKISSFFSPLGSKDLNSEMPPKKVARKSDDDGVKKDTEKTADMESRSEAGVAAPDETDSVAALTARVTNPSSSKPAAGSFLKDQTIINWEKKTHGVVVNFGSAWMEPLNISLSTPASQKLFTFVSEQRKKGKVFPPPQDVFTWTRSCKPHDVKVVVLGQDPYISDGQAHGLSFSVRKGVKPPPSLENIYKELTSDIPGFKQPSHGELTSWASQGVLMLNSCLTVQAYLANSHREKGWEKITDAVVSWIDRHNKGVVFLLWGAYAQRKGASINQKKHLILKSPHPSPLSAYRGFLGCKHFSQTNDYLVKQGKTPINWNIPE